MDRRISVIAIGCIVAGTVIGHFLIEPVLEYLQPEGVKFVIIRPGEGFETAAMFSAMLGLCLGLIPFLTRFLRMNPSKRLLPPLILAAAGFIGSVGAFFHLKLQLMRCNYIVAKLGLNQSISLPRIFLIPLTGIVFMLAVFILLKLSLKTRVLPTDTD